MPRRLRFLNPLTRDAAYSALLDPNRALLHGAAADALQARYVAGGAGEEQQLDELVKHLAAARQYVAAHRYCCDALYTAARAGSLARADRLEVQAEELWAAARADDPELAERSLRLLWARAELRTQRGAVEAALESLAALLAMARSAGDREYICRSLNSLGSLHYNLGELTQAESYVRNAEALAYLLGDPTLERYCAGVLGSILLRRGEKHEARIYMLRALEIARSQGNTARTAAELSNLASVETALGELASAEAHYRESLALARWLGNAYLTSLAAGNLGDMLHERGRSAEARELLCEALAIAREIARPVLQGYWLNALGFLELDTAHPGAATAHLEAARALFTRLGDRVQLSSALAGLGLAAAQAGERAAALALAAEAAELADETGIGPGSFTRRALARLAGQLQAAGG